MVQTCVRLISLLFVAGCTASMPAGSGQAGADSPARAKFRVAVIQLRSSQVGDYFQMNQLVQKAARAGAELVVFPESSVLGWLNPDVFADAKPIPGAPSRQFAAMARDNNVWIAAGLAERGANISPGINHAFDSGILINPAGLTVIRHRKHQVLRNAFETCPASYPDCQYTQAPASDVTVVDTPFGRTSILVCADAYTWDTTVLSNLKALNPQVVIVPWGVGASVQSDCGEDGFNATGFAAQAAEFLGSAYVIGANAVGTRPYGRLRPAVYCGNSGYANPDGTVAWQADTTQQIGIFDVPIPRQSQ